MLNAYEYGKLWNAVRMADPTETSIDPLRAIFQQDELNAMKSLHYDLLDKYCLLSSGRARRWHVPFVSVAARTVRPRMYEKDVCKNQGIRGRKAAEAVCRA